MKKVWCKKILVIMFLIVLIFSISTVSFASLSGITPNVEAPGVPQLMNTANVIMGIFKVIAVAVALIMLVVLAIKYMSAAPSEKADVKKSLTVYIVGALILFAGAGLLEIIESAAVEINKDLGVPPLSATTQSASGTTATPNLVTPSTGKTTSNKINLDPSKKTTVTKEQKDNMELARRYLNGEDLEENVKFIFSYKVESAEETSVGTKPKEEFRYELGDIYEPSAKVVEISVNETMSLSELQSIQNTIQQTKWDAEKKYKEENKDYITDKLILEQNADNRGHSAASRKKIEIVKNVIKSNVEKTLAENQAN